MFPIPNPPNSQLKNYGFQQVRGISLGFPSISPLQTRRGLYAYIIQKNKKNLQE